MLNCASLYSARSSNAVCACRNTRYLGYDQTPSSVPLRVGRSGVVSITTPDLPTRKGTDDGVWSYPKYLVFRQAQTAFEDLALYSEAQFNISTGATGDAERVRGEWITRGYLPTLGLQVERGRNFSPGDDHPDAPREAIISEALWQRRFGADSAIVGRTVNLNREPFT